MTGFNSTSKPARRSPWQSDNRKSPYSQHSNEDDGSSYMDVIFGKKKEEEDDLMKTRRKPVTSKDWTPPGFSSNRKSPVSSLK